MTDTTPSALRAEAPWRVGSHYGIHVYEGERPVATFHRPEDAARAVAALSAHGQGAGAAVAESLTDIIGKFTARSVVAAEAAPAAWRITLDDGSISYVESDQNAHALAQHYGANIDPLYLAAAPRPEPAPARDGAPAAPGGDGVEEGERQDTSESKSNPYNVYDDWHLFCAWQDGFDAAMARRADGPAAGVEDELLGLKRSLTILRHPNAGMEPPDGGSPSETDRVRNVAEEIDELIARIEAEDRLARGSDVREG